MCNSFRCILPFSQSNCFLVNITEDTINFRGNTLDKFPLLRCTMILHNNVMTAFFCFVGSTFGVGSRFVYLVGDIANLDSLREVFDHSTPDLVISLAGYGMSGSAMLDSYMCNLVNYEGTKNIIQVCREKNVQRLIYTSTYNVVYGGDPIENGTEALDYYPIDNHTDAYSATKAKAEIEILNANGTITASGDILVTSVIRPAAIYGPDEERHLPRIVKIMDLGLFAFRIGDPIVDWVHIDNLVSSYPNHSISYAH